MCSLQTRVHEDVLNLLWVLGMVQKELLCSEIFHTLSALYFNCIRIKPLMLIWYYQLHSILVVMTQIHGYDSWLSGEPLCPIPGHLLESLVQLWTITDSRALFPDLVHLLCGGAWECECLQSIPGASDMQPELRTRRRTTEDEVGKLLVS